MITVTVDPTKALAALGHFANDQLPFATALSLTRMAHAYNDHAREGLDEKFTIRTNWVGKGFRVERATKAKLEATSYHKDAFMRLQEEGGDKTPSAGKRSVAVPIGARPTPQAVTRPSQWPGKVKRGFVITTKKGERVLMQRTGRRGKAGRKQRAAARVARGTTGRDPNLRVMYLLEGKVRVKPRFGFRAGAVTFANANYNRIFGEAWAEAMRSAR